MNVFTFCGNLGNDCRSNSAGGTHVVNFSVAVTSGYGDKKETHWVECAYWGKGGEAVAQYLKKGQKVVVSGEAGMKAADGQYPAKLTCRVNSLTLAGGRDSSSESQQASRPAPAPAPAAATAPAAPLEGDDIPF